MDSRLSMSRPEIHGQNPYIAAGLAILVGVLVFALFWKLRKTFGMKE